LDHYLAFLLSVVMFFFVFLVWMMYLIEIKLPDISDNAAKDE